MQAKYKYIDRLNKVHKKIRIIPEQRIPQSNSRRYEGRQASKERNQKRIRTWTSGTKKKRKTKKKENPLSMCKLKCLLIADLNVRTCVMFCSTDFNVLQSNSARGKKLVKY